MVVLGLGLPAPPVARSKLAMTMVPHTKIRYYPSLMIGASQQAPPGNLSLSYILELARETAGGQLY